MRPTRAAPDRRLYPDDPADAAGVRALERDFDTRLGLHGRRWMYNGLRGRRDLAIAYGCTGVPPWERRTLSIAYPVLIRVIDRYLDITPATAAESEARVRATFDTVAGVNRNASASVCQTPWKSPPTWFPRPAA